MASQDMAVTFSFPILTVFDTGCTVMVGGAATINQYNFLM